MLEKGTDASVSGVEIGALDASEMGEVLGVIARGMRDNPLPFAPEVVREFRTRE